MSTTSYLAINPSALNIPPARDDAGIVQYMQDIKQILSELNHNLSLAIDAVNAHTTSLATIDTTLQNHDTSITQQDTSIVNLLSQIQTVAAAVGTNPPSSSSTTGQKVKLAMCRKLHQDPRINSDFPRFFPIRICTGFRSRDPGAYPCRLAALVSAKTPEFPLSISYPSESVIVQTLLSCHSIVFTTFLLYCTSMV
jgi:hypothetical protein